MAIGNLLGQPLKPNETRSVNVNEADRYVVSFASSYGNTKDDINTPQMAAAAALAMIFDSKSDETLWFVFDRKTGEMYAIEQGDFEDLMSELGMI